jgi:hypothetical protein
MRAPSISAEDARAQRGRMTVYVAGNCQAAPLAACLGVMLPNVVVTPLAPHADATAFAADGDVIFRQRNPRIPWTLRAARRNEILYPRLWFNAFHPDLVYVDGPPGPVKPPLGEFHSSLVLHAWRRGWSETDASALFADDVFERLGFFAWWAPAKRALFEEAEAAGFALDGTFAAWERGGCFMHAVNHPHLAVIADVARSLVERAGLEPQTARPEDYLHDPLLDAGVWPVYPDVASRLGISGGYGFGLPRAPAAAGPPELLGLDEFIARSFHAYAHADPAALVCARLDRPAYRELERRPGGSRASTPAARAPQRDAAAGQGPYAGLAPAAFWRTSMAAIPAGAVDPVGVPPFTIDRRTRIVTAGSCFAQHVSQALIDAGYSFHVTERAPAQLTATEARRAGYGAFSARYGNVYTARQLLQLFDRAYGDFVPDDAAWVRADGRYVDPFRPHVEPAGYATPQDVLAARTPHLAAVRAAFEEAEVLLFTLGLTEAWKAVSDGAVFPLAPGVAAGEYDPRRYAFENADAAEVTADLAGFVARLRRVNPAARIVLTVSPVALAATYEPRHVLVSTTYSKAALRVAAAQTERAHANVAYFPSFEIVTGAHSRGAYFAPDLRNVTAAGVDHVMRLFFAHYAPGGHAGAGDGAALREARDAMDVICDEDAIDVAGGGSDADERRAWIAAERQDDRPLREPAPEVAMNALDPRSMRARLEAALPAAMRNGAQLMLPCVVRNDGDVPLSTGAPHPVYVCYRWYDESAQEVEVGRALHTPLPDAVAPGAAGRLTIALAAPRSPGRYRLRVSLLQSEVAWFDDVDARNGLAAQVDVGASV